MVLQVGARLGNKGRVELRSTRGSGYGGCACAALAVGRQLRARSLTASLSWASCRRREYMAKLLQTASEWRSVPFPISTSIKELVHTMRPSIISQTFQE
ncbi:hypothetical protein J3F83DRAFT_681599 [Trichoderma novae-zelandiae]